MPRSRWAWSFRRRSRTSAATAASRSPARRCTATALRIPQRTFDGMGLNTMLGTGAGINYYFKINSVMSQEVTLTTDGQSAEYETGGLVTNVVPRDGGNRWSGVRGRCVLQQEPAELQPDRRAESSEDCSPTPVAKVIYDAGFGVGGPLRQDRLWFFAGARGGARSRSSPPATTTRARIRGNFSTRRTTAEPAYLDNWAYDNSVRVTQQVNANEQAQLLPLVAAELHVLGHRERRGGAQLLTGRLHGVPLRPDRHADGGVELRGVHRLLFEAAGMYLYQTIDSTPTPATDLTTISVTD